MSEKDNTEKWLKFLDPDNLKDRLIFSALFIAAFESFKDYIVDEVKFFFNNGFIDGEYTFSDSYKIEVLSKDKSRAKATLLWLKDYGVIDNTDIENFDELIKYRNKLSHELMKLLFEGLPDELPEKFIQLMLLRKKIEKWWIINVDVPTNSFFYSKKEIEIDESNISTSSDIFNQIILAMLSGDEELANSTLYRKGEKLIK